MEDNRVLIPAHPQGEVKRGDRDQDLLDRGKAVETFGGKVFVRWDAEAAVTAFAPVTYFLEFLKANGLWQQWVEDCPLNYRSGNASEVRTRLDYELRRGSGKSWKRSRGPNAVQNGRR